MQIPHYIVKTAVANYLAPVSSALFAINLFKSIILSFPMAVSFPIYINTETEFSMDKK